MKSIIDLCRELPGSEAELRERQREFNHTVQAAVMPAIVVRNFMNNIADAKAATDAMNVQGWGFLLTIRTDGACDCSIFHSGRQESAFIAASTEELARSAAALLAAEAMKEKYD